MPPRNVVPKPVQKPHPPLWVACSRRDTILLAAEKGIGALSFAFVEPEDARQWVEDYEAVLRDRCVPVGLAVNPQVACVTPMMCAPREEDALARGLEGANFFGYSLAHYYVFGDHVPAATDVWEEFLEPTRLDRLLPRGRAGHPPPDPGGQGRSRGPDRTAGGHRHSGPATPVSPALRGGRRGPAHLRHAGRPQPSRGHHGVDRAVRDPGAPRVRRAGRGGRPGQGGPVGALRRGRLGPPQPCGAR